MAELEMRLRVAPESNSALATMVFPVGPVSKTWLVMSKLVGILSFDTELNTLTETLDETLDSGG